MNHLPLIRFIVGILFFSAVACAGRTHNTTDWRCAAADARCSTVFVVYDAWHAAIVLAKEDLPVETIPETADFPNARYLEFSWGDEDYFPAPSPGVSMALTAAFWSSGSVVHVVGFDAPVRQFYPNARVVELRLSDPAYDDLTTFLAESFNRPASAPRAPARPGLYDYSRFYPSTKEFSLLNTCNTWVARALAKSGVPITPTGVILASQLGDQLEEIVAADRAF